MNPTIEEGKECMTIVVPVYNRRGLIVRCLDSLKGQSYRPLRIIVVDNGSTDDTVAVMEKWRDANQSGDLLVDVMSDSRRGAAYARQRGLDEVSTDKVMFFDSDDVMRPECVEEVMRSWADRPSADMVAWPVTFRRPGGPVESHSIKGNLTERHLVHSVFRTQGYAVRAAFLRGCGGWRGDYPVWNDFETGTRLILKEPEVIAIGRSLVDVYPQAESITGLGFSEKHGKWEKSLDGIDCSISGSGRRDMERLHNIVTYRRAVLAAHYAKEGHREYAEPLYRQAVNEIKNTKRPLIRFAYHWTRLGMRGAFSIVGKFL